MLTEVVFVGDTTSKGDLLKKFGGHLGAAPWIRQWRCNVPNWRRWLGVNLATSTKCTLRIMLEVILLYCRPNIQL